MIAVVAFVLARRNSELRGAVGEVILSGVGGLVPGRLVLLDVGDNDKRSVLTAGEDADRDSGSLGGLAGGFDAITICSSRSLASLSSFRACSTASAVI